MGKRRSFPKETPSFDKLIIPTLNAIKKLGGSGSIDEIAGKVIEIEEISDDILGIQHVDGGAQSEVEYRLAWARTYLSKVGLLTNSARGIWSLTDPNIDLSKINPNEIVKKVRAEFKPVKEVANIGTKETLKNEDEDEFDDQVDSWKDELITTVHSMTPDAFERLAQRILRESGFSNVEVTGKIGDEGIDGKGIVRISGFLSFHVIFQCKKYSGSVSPSQIRDFRGAMQGRADKGLFITTGSFTNAAIKEATRDGAPPIDLIDGERLCDILKEYKLGVSTRMVEVCEVQKDWFTKI